MNWYIEGLKKYAQFSGRSRRKEYWFFILFNAIIAIILAVIDNATGNYEAETGAGLLGGIYGLAVLIPTIAVSVRRLHDTDRSGWWLLLALIPVIGGLILLYFMFIDSMAEENQYGANPKAAND